MIYTTKQEYEFQQLSERVNALEKANKSLEAKIDALSNPCTCREVGGNEQIIEYYTR